MKNIFKETLDNSAKIIIRPGLIIRNQAYPDAGWCLIGATTPQGVILGDGNQIHWPDFKRNCQVSLDAINWVNADTDNCIYPNHVVPSKPLIVKPNRRGLN